MFIYNFEEKLFHLKLFRLNLLKIINEVIFRKFEKVYTNFQTFRTCHNRIQLTTIKSRTFEIEVATGIRVKSFISFNH